MHLLHGVLCCATLLSVLNLTRAQKRTHIIGPDQVDKHAFECQQQLKNVKMFAVFPGLGWDNIRNVEAGQAVKYTYEKCKLTSDGQYLIPDNVYTIPIKRSHVAQQAELFESWTNTSSLTSSTINVNAGLSYKGASISGSFSHDMRSSKQKQIQSKTAMVRTKMQFNRYKSRLQAHSPPSEQFVTSVMNVAARIQHNQTEMANYEAQLLVRDFGTHYLTSVTAGAALVKEDYISRDYVASQVDSRTKILTSASVSYLKTFSADTSYKHSTQTSESKSYKNSLRSSEVKALGGPILGVSDIKLAQWTNQVDSNLVAMDKMGDPINFLITPNTFPDLPPDLVKEVAAHVHEAIKIYYEMNMIPGCTRPGAPQFSPIANMDDGSCSTNRGHTSFGGVFQECSVSGSYLDKDPCFGMTSRNPKTGQYSCPSTYKKVLIYEGSKVGDEEWQEECYGCGFWIFVWTDECCDKKRFQATANYKSYWCAGSGLEKPTSGYRFGGVYTSTSFNLVTGTKGCPKHFRNMTLLEDLTICLSDDFELSSRFSVAFAGFFSCQAGNPLALQNFRDPGHSSQSVWPAHCPEGYSQHLATVTKECAIHYCAESRALVGVDLPIARRPPFMLRPAVPMVSGQDYIMFDMRTQLLFGISVLFSLVHTMISDVRE